MVGDEASFFEELIYCNDWKERDIKLTNARNAGFQFELGPSVEEEDKKKKMRGTMEK